VLVHAEVKFDSDLPEFRTTGGVNAGNNKNEYDIIKRILPTHKRKSNSNTFPHRFFVQPVMWVKALDMVMDRLVVQGADLSTVAAISGSAQQHGSLYWSKHGLNTLKNLDSDKFLHTQIDDSAFTVTR
jgi:xylulokinase